MAEKKQAATTPAPTAEKKKKINAYDEPFGNEITAFYPEEQNAPKKVAEKPAVTQTIKSESDAPEKEPDAPKPQKKTTGASSGKKSASPKPASEAKKKSEDSKSTAKKPNQDKHIQSTTATPYKETKSDAKKEKKEPQDTDEPRSSRPAHRVIPFVLAAFAVFIGVSLLLNLFCNQGNVLAKNPYAHWMGVVGYYICNVLFGTFGPAVFTLPLLMINLAIYWKRFVDHKIAISKIIVSVLFLLVLASVIHVFFLISYNGNNFSTSELWNHGTKMTGGGVLGGKLGFLLFHLCHYAGALIIGFILLLASLFYCLGMTPQYLWNYIRNRRKVHNPKRTRSSSEQDAEEAGNRVKMEEKIRRSTAKQSDAQGEGDFEAEAPLGAVRVVRPAPEKKNAADRIAPMPDPHLDPNDGEDVFVPEVVNARMMAAEEEQKQAHYEAFKQEYRAKQANAYVPHPPVKSESNPEKPIEKPANPAANRDAAVDPIFPRVGEPKQIRRVPRSDRNFDLKTIFIDIDETEKDAQRKHTPVPPEVPMSGSKSAQSIPKPTGATTTPVKAPNAVRTAKAPVEGAETLKAPAKTAPTAPTATAKPLPRVPKPGEAKAPSTEKTTFKQAAPEKQDFGLSNEEFEKLEAQQITLPKPGAKKPVDAATPEKKPMVAKTEKAAPAKAEKPVPAKPANKRYIFPPISYLHPGEPMTEENIAELRASMEALAATLRSFHVGIEDDIRYSCGPTVTRYEITPAAGVRVRTITNLSDDIALALRASGGIRIEAPIPGTNSVGIEVPNKTRSTIYLRELIESPVFSESKNKLTACLGAGIAGEPLIFDIAKMPHLLIAGTTGSGKSVCINCIVMSLLYKATPDEVKLVMIDPKKVEFSIYKNIPHLMAPVVTTPKDAAGALQASVEEMERRFELFENVGVRDLKGYNAATADDPDMPNLPHIVIIIDELADLMMTARDEVETAICRIAQKARAAGMHLIIGTQRPSADVVTGLIKSNVPSRIAFAVKSQVDSRVILDHIGAEALTGRGDMLFVPIGSMRDTRVQGAFVDDKEVEKICEFIRATNGQAEYDEKFISKLKELAAQCGNKGKSGGDAMPVGEDGGDKSDNKYADAVRIAIEEKRVSTSLLQRKLEIGYSRAAKLIDRMQSEGLVSPPDGSKPRTILITPEEYMARFVDNPEGE